MPPSGGAPMPARDDLELRASQLAAQLSDELVESSEQVDFRMGTYLLAALAAHPPSHRSKPATRLPPATLDQELDRPRDTRARWRSAEPPGARHGPGAAGSRSGRRGAELPQHARRPGDHVRPAQRPLRKPP